MSSKKNSIKKTNVCVNRKKRGVFFKRKTKTFSQALLPQIWLFSSWQQNFWRSEEANEDHLFKTFNMNENANHCKTQLGQRIWSKQSFEQINEIPSRTLITNAQKTNPPGAGGGWRNKIALQIAWCFSFGRHGMVQHPQDSSKLQYRSAGKRETTAWLKSLSAISFYHQPTQNDQSAGWDFSDDVAAAFRQFFNWKPADSTRNTPATFRECKLTPENHSIPCAPCNIMF